MRWRGTRLDVQLPGFVPELARRAGVQQLTWSSVKTLCPARLSAARLLSVPSSSGLAAWKSTQTGSTTAACSSPWIDRQRRHAMISGMACRDDREAKITVTTSRVQLSEVQTPSQSGLAMLGRMVDRDLDLLGLPPANWPAAVAGPDGAPVLDVAVIGAGMYGIAATAALVLKGVRNVVMLDKAPEGWEGPWVTTARMEMLRSPKHLPGVALGIPSLTFRSWYEAAFGAEAWATLYKIANADWQSYLTWVRRVLRLPLRSGVEVLSVTPHGDLLALSVREGGVARTWYARRVVLATGRAGTGGFAVPPGIEPALWPDRAAHSGENIAFTRLRGRRVAVIGAGPSAWDNAATALEHGAARVDMYARRRELPQINKGRGSANPGFFEGWASLPPQEKWRLLVYLHDLQAPPPHESVLRALHQPGFHIHLGTRVLKVRQSGDEIALTLDGDATASADFLILGTGFAVDLARVHEIAAIAPHVATWGDRYAPPPQLKRPEIARFPWLGDGFELTERVPNTCPGLARIHLFNHAAFASLGAIASDIPGASTGAERLAHAIAAHLFVEDIDDIRARLEAFAEPELQSTPFYVPERFPPGA